MVAEKLVKLINSFILESFYIDHQRPYQLTKTKLFQLKLLNCCLLLIDERDRDKLKLKQWHKSEYQTAHSFNAGNLQQEKLILNKLTSDSSCRDMSTN